MMHAALLMDLARERVADLLRAADSKRPEGDGRAEAPKPVGSPYRAADGSWIYGRRDSS
jgi:hypothetical protein